MSARSCQLCGKPLSRIWVGSGGDFCSREHRNQFRLRQGMGRLQEANKVASVMRRREQLRPITTPGVSHEATVARRGFFQTRFVASAKQELPPIQVAASVPAPRVSAVSKDFIPPRPISGSPATAPKASMTLGFSPRPASMSSRRRARKLSTRMEQAPTVKLATEAPPTEAKRWISSMRLSARKRLPWTRLIAAKHMATLLGARSNDKPVEFSPAQGKVLRVSFACGFRPRARRRGFPPTSVRLQSGLRWREQKRSELRAFAPEETASRVANGISMPLGPLAIPMGPEPVSKGERKPRPLMAVPMPHIFEGQSPTPQVADAPWIPQAEATLFPDVTLAHWRPNLLRSGSHISLKSSVATGPGASRHLAAPFVPQDLPCEFSLNVNQNGGKDQKR